MITIDPRAAMSSSLFINWTSKNTMHLIIDTISTSYPLPHHSEMVREKVELFDSLLSPLNMEVECLHSKYGDWRTTQIVTSPLAYELLAEYLEAIGN